MVDEILQFEHEDALSRRLEKRFGFDSNTASQLAALRLEDEYDSLSKQAIRRILPLMKEKRIRFAAARKEIYGDKFDEDKTAVRYTLPQVLKDRKNADIPFFRKTVRSPIAVRTLTEVRKVVNAVVRKYGKPELIRCELAGDMKKGRKRRETINIENRHNEKKRIDIKKQIFKECGIWEPRPIDIFKMLLAEECNWICPYTGKTITPRTLLGDNPQFDIEHILPFSRSLDNSQVNKTLCDVKEKRDVKKNQTPWEAYGHDPQRWNEILQRLSNFQGPFAAVKNRRFELQEIPEGFINRSLTDTQYISRLTGEYLGLLFGGKIDADGTQRIQVSSGGITAYLRGEWKLNEIVDADGGKNFADHRHHAIDAVVIACLDTGMIQKLVKAAEQASEQGIHRLFIKGGVAAPFAGFHRTVGKAVDDINVSYRMDKKISGCLHGETNYSPLLETTVRDDLLIWRRINSHHIRKPVTSLTTEKQINSIVDPVIRCIVLEKWKALPNGKFTADDLPFMTAKDGRIIPIKKVRVRDNTKPKILAEGKLNERYVATEGNHHFEIFEVLNQNGSVEKSGWRCVSLFEAMQRKIAGVPVVAQSDHYGDGTRTRLKYSLLKNELVEASLSEDETVLLRVVSISERDLLLSLHSDARADKERRETGDYQKYRLQRIQRLEALKIRKVTVDVLGGVHPANG